MKVPLNQEICAVIQTITMDTRKRMEIEEKAARTAYLLFNYLQNKLTEEEDAELAAWMLENEQNWKLFQEFTGQEYKKKFSAKSSPEELN